MNPSLLSQIQQGAGIAGSLFGGQGAGGAGSLAGMAAFFSDRRLKEDIAQVGTLFDGTPVYRYRYIGHNAFQIGLMAQDVEKTTPEAVVEINGFKAVEYKAATEKAARTLDWGC
jgi:hypothetical protein